MTPIEETIQRLMEPDKHGEKGEPARCAAFVDLFGHPVQRTLDALWKFAETSNVRLTELEAGLSRIRRETRDVWAQREANALLGSPQPQAVDVQKGPP
jgi:hypothetical protein